MRINNIGEFSKLKEVLPKEITCNPLFETIRSYFQFSEGISYEVTVNDDKTVTIEKRQVPYIETIRLNSEKARTYDRLTIKPTSTGGIELFKTSAELTDAKSFYEKQYREVPLMGSFRPESLLSERCIYQFLDKNGIEQEYTEYKFDNQPLRIRYEDKNGFHNAIRSFLPQFIPGGRIQENNTVVNPKVESHLRDKNNPGIKEIISYGISHGSMTDYTRKFSSIFTENPHFLVTGGVFAEEKNGKKQVVDPYGEYPGYTFEQVVEEESRKFEEGLEHSNTKEYGLPQYAILKEQMQKVNKNHSSTGIQR